MLEKKRGENGGLKEWEGYFAMEGLKFSVILMVWLVLLRKKFSTDGLVS